MPADALRMTPSGTPLGARLSAAGAGLLLASLWLPWYQISFPPAFREALRGVAGGPAPTTGAAPVSPQGIGGAVNAIVAGLATAIPDSIAANGWEAMKSADVILAVIVGLTVVLLTNGLGLVRVDEAGRGRALAALGLLAVAIVGFHVIRRPFGDLPGFVDTPSLRYGMGVALVGAVFLGAGGHLLARQDELATVVEADALTPYVPPARAQAGEGASVAPPGL